MAASHWERPRVAVDVGGTFIDVVIQDPVSGALTVEKQPSTPDRLTGEVLTALGRLPVPPGDLETIVHGSTVAINALVQERGARVGLLTTEKFRDVLEIGLGARPEIDNWLYVPPMPLVPRNLRAEVVERMGPDGTVLTPLSHDSVVASTEHLVRSGVESLAICFLHSYANSEHEQAAKAAIATEFPGLPVTASYEISSEWHEFERTYTTVINAYIRPIFDEYIRSLLGELEGVGFTASLPVMQSNGGVISAKRAAELPVRTVQSGPAGGVIGAQATLSRLGIDNAICTDVGGTTFDVALIESGQVVERTQVAIGGRPILAPTIGIVSIGAGGGSIAWIDEAGALRVGPKSAGAEPGPACFGRGGADPTVTDCQVILGRLDPGTYLGSRMPLSVDAAREAVDRVVASPLAMTVESAALGVLTLAENAMANAMHDVVIGRAVDPRDLVVFAYGGGGGQFAAATADEIGADGVVIPRAPGAFSAWGILGADFREDAAMTSIRVLVGDVAKFLVSDFAEVRARAVGHLAAFGLSEDTFILEHRADMRFVGQEYTIATSIDPEWLEDDSHDLIVERMCRAFTAAHRGIYGHGDEAAPIEVVTLRCRAISATDTKPWHPPVRPRPGAPIATRSICFDDRGFIDSGVYQRDDLGAGQHLTGPAVIEEWNASLLLPPGWEARVMTGGELHLTRDGSS